MRRGVSVVAIGLGLAVLLGAYAVYTQRVVSELRREASRTARMYAQVYRALSDTSADNSSALFELGQRIRESGVPLVLTDAQGNPTDYANIPVERATDRQLREYVRQFDLTNEPVVEPALGTTIHYGNTRLVRGL